MTEKLAYSPKEATEAAPVGRTFLYEAIKSGALKTRKLGRKRLILRDDLTAWLKGLPT
ncbi:helix-turn-helix domain-containing protein [Hyphomicrobium sp.]|jgi:excisionase family DNA binding protein|uniref:helix-turn-helix domain-containing protein n=1 Tax=Hyphomicrobium sp. TaxID=82 RepID=UPI002C60CEAF|nr:helix-turn-helix domain-containing protein [Hyphomicrobium sp.]HVZ06235.1 helix-turn-helix domain-containing protein [Hyphomicrobium sp.]